MERVKEILSRTRDHPYQHQNGAPEDIAERLQPVIDEKRGSAEIIFELEFPGRYTASGPAKSVRQDLAGPRIRGVR